MELNGGLGLTFLRQIPNKKSTGKDGEIPNSRACWVSISRAGAGSRGLAAFKIRNEPWNPGTLGTLEPWNPETLEPRNPGTLKPWNPGTETLEPSNPATVEP